VCSSFTLQEFFQEMLNQDSAAARFMKQVTSKCQAYSPEAMRNKRDVFFGPGFVSYDSYAMAACIDSTVVTKSVECGVHVELQGTVCRGMMALDLTDQLKKPHRVSVMTECDLEKFRKLLADSLRQPCEPETRASILFSRSLPFHTPRELKRRISGRSSKGPPAKNFAHSFTRFPAESE